jgi:hypothetical protein
MRAARPFDALIQQVIGGLAMAKPVRRAPKSLRNWLVFTLKKGSRVASGVDVHKRALALKAMCLKEQGLGGGISDLLIPTDVRESARLERDRNLYTLDMVSLRKPTSQKATRDQLNNPELLLELILICPANKKWKKIDFARWWHSELGRHGSGARKLTATYAPELLAAKRSVGWFYRNLGKKMSR